MRAALPDPCLRGTPSAARKGLFSAIFLKALTLGMSCCFGPRKGNQGSATRALATHGPEFSSPGELQELDTHVGRVLLRRAHTLGETLKIRFRRLVRRYFLHPSDKRLCGVSSWSPADSAVFTKGASSTSPPGVSPTILRFGNSTSIPSMRRRVGSTLRSAGARSVYRVPFIKLGTPAFPLRSRKREGLRNEFPKNSLLIPRLKIPPRQP